MTKHLVKVRLSNCRKIKPFWISKDDLKSASNNVSRFMSSFISRNRSESFNRHNLIYFAQIPAYRVSGFEHKTYVKDSPNIKKIRKFDKHYGKYNYITNTKVDHWASFDIHPVPALKVINQDFKLKDSSGINAINVYEMQKILIRNRYGVFYENTLNYAKNVNELDINLSTNIILENGDHKSNTSVSPMQFLETVFSAYCAAKNHKYLLSKVVKLMRNSIYGELLDIISYHQVPSEYINMMKNPEFGKFIITGKSSDTTRVVMLYMNNQNPMFDELEKFATDYNLTTNDTINVTFESNFINKEI